VSPFTLRRQAARVVLLNEDGHILLIRASDPADASKGYWWEIPGGGIDPHETTADAARRELHEETGITTADIGPCVWTQHCQFTFAGWHFDQDEFVHVAWCTGDVAFRPAGLEAFEAMAFEGHRWWPLDELLTSDAKLLPHRMREFLPALVAGDLPTEPFDITHTGGW
jgi:8-oxo-dGTP pyrophosphatase MutT (NUDIX family)